MAVVLTSPVAEGEVEAAIAKVSPELAFLLQNTGVPPPVVAKIGSLGITSVDIFAQIEPDVSSFRTFASSDLGLDPSKGVPNKIALATLVGAWDSANTRGKRRREEEAEQRVGDHPRKLPRTTHLDLRRAFASRHRELRDEETPHTSYLEAKLQEVEEGEFRAERLCDVLSLADDDGSSTTGLTLAADGTIKARKASAIKGTIPSNSEQLRLKLKLMAHAWEYVRLKVPKDFLADFDLHLYSEYADWLLGDKVAGLCVSSPGSAATCKPSWALVLSFDFEFRKRVAHEANSKKGDLKSFFEAAYKDETLYNTCLLTPLSLDAGASAARALLSSSSLSHPAQSSSSSGFADTSFGVPFPPVPPKAKGAKGKGSKKDKKGKGKGDKKGKGKGSKDQGIAGNVCWRFNRGRCPGKCGRIHACLTCWSPDHGSHECPLAKSH